MDTGRRSHVTVVPNRTRTLHRGSGALFLAGALSAGLLMATGAFADTVWRTNGSKVVGKIIAEEEHRIQLEIERGSTRVTVWIPRTEIELIQRGLTPLEEFHARLAALAPHDLDGHRALLKWLEQQRLVAEAARVSGRLPEVERLHRKHTHVRTWCRTCDARGKIACPNCTGKGHLVGTCARCDGKGRMLCQVCGHLSTPGVLRCRKCSGAGEVERFNPAKGRKEKGRCADCSGKGTQVCPGCEGKVQAPCSECQGKGGTQSDCPDCDEEPYRSCPTCTGTCLQPTPVTDEQLALEAAAARAAEQSAASAQGAEGKRPGTPGPAEPGPGEGSGGAGTGGDGTGGDGTGGKVKRPGTGGGSPVQPGDKEVPKPDGTRPGASRD